MVLYLSNMRKDIDLNKVKEYADNIVNLYEDVDPVKFNEWFSSTGYIEVQDSTEEILANGIVDYYVNDILDNEDDE